MDGFVTVAIEDASVAGSLTMITTDTSLNFTLEHFKYFTHYMICSKLKDTTATATEDQRQVDFVARLNLICLDIHSVDNQCEHYCLYGRDFSYYIDRLAIRRFMIASFKKVKHLINHDSCEKMVTLIYLFWYILKIIFIRLGTRILSEIVCFLSVKFVN